MAARPIFNDLNELATALGEVGRAIRLATLTHCRHED